MKSTHIHTDMENRIQKTSKLTNDAAWRAVMNTFKLGGAVAGLTVALLLLMAGSAARAAVPVPIANPGFEDPVLADGAFNSTIPNWTEGTYNVANPAVWVVGASGVGVYNVSTAEYTSGLAPEGENMAYTTSLAGFDVGLNQVLAGATATLQADTTYDLSAVVGNPYVYNGYTNTADYRIELVAGGVVLATNTGPSPTNDTYWTTASLSYTSSPAPAQLGQQLEIRLLAVNLPVGKEVDFDSVSLTATYAGPTSNANLIRLEPSAGTLTPPFSSGTFSYTATVPNATASMTVTPTSADPNATITVNGSPVASGNPSGDISLNVGANVITAVVVSQDTTATNTYTLAVTRTSNANLANLVPSVGTLTPAFDLSTFSYTASAPFTNNSMTVTPTASEFGQKITVNGSPVTSGNPSGAISLNIGANVITTVVVSADTTATNTYTLTVTRDGPITVVNTAVYTNYTTAGTTPLTIFSSYPVTGVDKLVVTISGEHGFPNGLGIITNVTYAGQPMATAIKLENGQTAYREGVVGIFYLDNPSQYGDSGDIVLDKNGSWNSYGASVMSLVGTAPGVDATSSSLVIIPTLVESVSIVTKTEYNVVVAATENGTGNTGVQPFAQPPMTQVLSFKKTPGNAWTGGGSGYQFVKGLASATSTFTNTTTTAATTLAASFGVAIPTLSWDIDGNTAGAGGATPAGAWDATTANWNANYLGTGDAATWTNGMAAAFAAGTDATGAYTVTVDGTRDIASLAFEEGAVTLTGGTALRVSGFAIVNTASGLSATIETPLSEDAAGRRLTKTGSGTVVLAGNNTYTGDTAVSPAGGTLVLAGTNTAATGGMSLNGGVTRFESPVSINGTARNIAVNAGGAAAFGPSFGAANIPAALSGRIAAASAGAIAADNYDTLNFDFNTPGLTAASLGAVGNVTYTGTLTPNGTTYRLGGGGGTLTMANANALTGVGNSLVVNGNVILPSANDFTGGTTLNVGNLGIGNNNCIGSGSLTVNGGGMSSDSATARTVTNAITIATDVTLGNTVNNGKLTFTGPAGLGTVNRVFSLNSEAELAEAISGAGGALTKAGTNNLTLSGANTYSGATTVNKGTLVLLGSNNSAGSTLLSEGTTLQLGGSVNGGLAGGLLTIGALNATVLQPIGADRKFTNAVSLTYIASVGGTALISGSENLEIGGTFTFASGGGGNRTLISSLDAGKALTLSGLVRLTDSGTARNQTINVTNEARITGVVTNGGAGVGSLTKSGPGLLILANDNRYTGVTTAGGGVLQLNSANALPGGIGTAGGTNNLTFNGGVVGLGAGDFTRSLNTVATKTAATFTGNGGWAAYGADRVVNLGGASDTISWSTPDTGLNNRTLILGAPTATHMVTLQNPLDLDATPCTVQVDDGATAVDATLSGVLSGGGLTKTGAGTLQLTAANTYFGPTTINGGRLQAGVAWVPSTSGAFGLYSAVTLADTNGAILDITGYDTEIGSLTGGGATGGNVILGANTLTIGSDTSSPAAYAGIISGTGGLTKIGVGTLTLSGTNTYSGLTKVAGGVLSCSSPDSLGGGALAITTGGLLDLNYVGNRNVASLTLDGVLQPNGIYGSSSSPATTVDNVHFTGTGTGTVTVGAVIPPPALGFAPNGDGTFTLTWTSAMLLEATNVMGPWTTNTTAISPLKVTPDKAMRQMYYRLQAP